VDSGPKGLQNKPVITSAKNTSGATTVKANLNCTPAKTFTVQFFSNPSGEEGKKYIGQKLVTTDASGNASFTFKPASKVAAGQMITATARARVRPPDPGLLSGFGVTLEELGDLTPLS
jgi:hypothetical protein